MAYRVYDTEQREWIQDGIYMNPDGDLFMIKQSLFGMVKIPLALSPYRYTYHKAIDLYDKNNLLVYEGDYLEAKISEDKTVIGLVCFAEELSSYIILCEEDNTFYTLGSEICEYIEVVGNVFDGY